eukprot:TRINITY_DN18729_c0_g1_i2.p1 TRINITY_DN18729_c0_g1~~TRINITY_DN18729_c0_g1_i2.p1  ORF type:complete len:203 (+),score=33.59 TRINITY_DN18729_c0_g1_i2:78-611(+)
MSKITSIRIKLIVNQIIQHLLGGVLDFEKIGKNFAGLDASDIKASIAAIIFILTNAAKYDVDDATLTNELQQLGLPKEHCDALSRSYKDNAEKLRTEFSKRIFEFPRLSSVNWRVDYIVGSSALKDTNVPTVTLNLEVRKTENIEQESFELSAEKFRVLFNDLCQARAIMETLEGQK